MKLVLILISSILVNNFIFSRFLGCCPFLGVSKKLETALGMGMAVTFVMTVASLLTWLLQRYLLAPFGIEYIQTVAFVLVIAVLVQLVEMVAFKSSPSLYRALGVYLPLITTNCAVLGVAILNINEGYGLVEAVVNGAGSALGFTLAIVLFAGIREHMDESLFPEWFRGFPAALVSAGLMSIAFLGFQGLI